MTANKTKVHTQYRLKSGTLVPGTTTVLSLLAKPALIAWAYNCGVKGIDYRKVRDNSADIGTLAHALILAEFTGQTPDTSEYSPADLAKAQNSLKSFHSWLAVNPLKPVLVETPLVSETFGFGGTPDVYAIRQTDNAHILIDFKTGKAIYAEASIQCASYGYLIYENTGKWPDRTIILRINTGANDDFEIKTVEQTDKRLELFKHLLRVYTLQKELT